jgi:hypothetical protein
MLGADAKAPGALGAAVVRVGVTANCDSTSGVAMFAAWSFRRKALSVAGMLDKVCLKVHHIAN